MTIRLTKVTIGDPPCQSPEFTAYVKDGEHWNGWAVPYFARDEAEKVMAWVNSTSQDFNGGTVMRVRHWGLLGYAIEDGNNGPAPEYVRTQVLVDRTGTSVDRPGNPVITWSIGGMSWTWEEVSEDDDWTHTPIGDGRMLHTRTEVLPDPQADTARAWQRGWTYLADEQISPLDHRLRDLLKVPEALATAPPRLRAALTDLLGSVTIMLNSLPQEKQG